MTKTEKYFLSADNKTNIRYNEWNGEDEPCGIFMMIHGVAEHIDRYDELAQTMVGEGYICCGADNLGHGKSGEIGYTPAYADKYFVEDAKKLYDTVKSEYPSLPIILFGHSLGSCIARIMIQQYDLDLKALILCGTGHLPGIARLAVPVFKKQQTSRETVKNSIPLSWLSYDKSNREDYAQDPLVAHTTTKGFQASANLTVAEACKPGWANRLPDNTPVLVISGVNDPFGIHCKGPKRVGKDLRRSGVKNVTVTLYKNAKHEILNEGNVKKEVLKDIAGWIKRLDW